MPHCTRCDKDIAWPAFAQFGPVCLNCLHPYVPEPEKWAKILANVEKGMEGWIWNREPRI